MIKYDKKISDKHKGKKLTAKHKEKLRIATINYVEKVRLNGNFLYPCVDKYEKSILDYLEEMWDCKIVRQKRVSGYFIDGYCPMFNLAIEVDEPSHKYKKKKDVIRENNIKEELNCSFLRINIGGRE